MSNKSKVLALKYRPQVFEDLIGQELAVKTIFNSIKENKVPNAYLFTGIRGIGKTTIARIVAKALNCKNIVAYKVEAPEGSVVKASTEASVDISAILALGDADHGKKVFKKCSACHSIKEGGKNNNSRVK